MYATHIRMHPYYLLVSVVCSAPAGGPLKNDFGFLAFSGIARLTWLVDLFGELSVSGATMVEDKEKNYMKMTVQLQTEKQK